MNAEKGSRNRIHHVGTERQSFSISILRCRQQLDYLFA